MVNTMKTLQIISSKPDVQILGFANKSGLIVRGLELIYKTTMSTFGNSSTLVRTGGTLK